MAVFSLLFLLIYHPFSETAWLGFKPDETLAPTLFFYLVSIAILLISRALSPAKISSIDINEENKTANVYMKSDQVSLAIGKGGYNIKLASKLAGYDIDIFRDDVVEEEDVDLDEFKDEFDDWVIEAFKKIGCDTAKNVLAIDRDELVQRTDLEEETVDEVLASIKKELDIE